MVLIVGIFDNIVMLRFRFRIHVLENQILTLFFVFEINGTICFHLYC